MKKILFIAATCILSASYASHSDNPLSYSNENNPMQSQPSDAEITANIKAMLSEDTSLSSDARKISVKTEGGVVTLRGTVASEDERYQVISMVEEVPGVIEVRDQLFVSHSLE